MHAPEGLPRRRFLSLAALAAASACLPGAAWSLARNGGPRRLAFHNLHTGERLARVYWRDGAYLPGALAEIDRHLRDHRTGEVRAIDPRLLDRLHDLRGRLASPEPFAVISGYRSPETNAMLAARNAGVGKHSFHTRGMAIDVSLPGRDLDALRRAALAQRAGGVGYYPDSGFVHVDVGPVRSW